MQVSAQVFVNISSSKWLIHNDICKNKCSGHEFRYQSCSGSYILTCDEVKGNDKNLS